ncbi:MAG: 1,4-dihydroxy-2-naphthoate polyprenyltransferase [Opitutales bacterium]
MQKWSPWVEATRPKTLPAALAPVVLGSGAAWADGVFYPLPAVICLAFALLIQIGTNFANDYLDGMRGSDTKNRLGPQRAVASGLIAPGRMRAAAVAVLAAAFCTGLGLIPFGGWWLLGVGVAAVACAWLYTGGPYPLAYHGLGDVFVVLFFGFIAVGFTYYVQSGTVTRDVPLLGLGCGLLVNNILVVNNYRDRVEDEQARKRTLVVRLGERWALAQYFVSVLLAGAVVLWFLWRGYGAAVLLGLLPCGIGIWFGMRLAKAVRAEEYLSVLRATGMIAAGYALLFAVGMVL